jgi:hypothetical protein
MNFLAHIYHGTLRWLAPIIYSFSIEMMMEQVTKVEGLELILNISTTKHHQAGIIEDAELQFHLL